MLAAGRIDAFCTVPEAIAVALMTSGRSSKKINRDERITLSSKKVWILLNPSVSKDVRLRLRDAALHVRSEGILDSIFREKLGGNYSVRLPR